MPTKAPLQIRTWIATTYCRPLPQLTRRYAHASSIKLPNNPFPYPTHRNPTPHQIFHLPQGATESDVKDRYYELVRLYHPDKLGAAPSSSADDAHTRFQTITAAYDALRGKTTLSGSFGPGSVAAAAGAAEAQYRTTAAYRAARRRRQELYDRGSVDDSRMDKWLIAGVVGTIVFVIMHTATTRRDVLAEAVSRSRSLAASQTQSQRAREAEERLSLETVSQTNRS